MFFKGSVHEKSSRVMWPSTYPSYRRKIRKKVWPETLNSRKLTSITRTVKCSSIWVCRRSHDPWWFLMDWSFKKINLNSIHVWNQSQLLRTSLFCVKFREQHTYFLFIDKQKNKNLRSRPLRAALFSKIFLLIIIYSKIFHFSSVKLFVPCSCNCRKNIRTDSVCVVRVFSCYYWLET